MLFLHVTTRPNALAVGYSGIHGMAAHLNSPRQRRVQRHDDIRHTQLLRMSHDVLISPYSPSFSDLDMNHITLARSQLLISSLVSTT